MIKTFKCKETEKIFNGKFSKKLPHDIQGRALIKLHSLDIAEDIKDLLIPPSNKLEQLESIVNEYIKNNHKILIFSSFKTALNIVKEKLNKAKIKT